MDDKRLETIYRKYRLLVLHVAYEMLGDANLAQDICQDVFMKLSDERINNIPTEQKMKNYLCVVTRNRVYDWSRKAYNRREFCLDMDNYNAEGEDVLPRKICMDEFASKLFDALREKNEQWYEIILRLDVYDEKQEIVARDMKISYGLLRTKYHRARSWIKKNFASEYEELKWF